MKPSPTLEEIRTELLWRIETDGPGDANFTQALLTVGNCRDLVALISAQPGVSPGGEGVTREALLNLFADARVFKEHLDGDEVNGRAVSSCEYELRVDHASLRALCEAAGLPVPMDKSVIDAAFDAIDAENGDRPFKSVATSAKPTSTNQATPPLTQLRLQQLLRAIRPGLLIPMMERDNDTVQNGS